MKLTSSAHWVGTNFTGSLGLDPTTIRRNIIVTQYKFHRVIVQHYV